MLKGPVGLSVGQRDFCRDRAAHRNTTRSRRRPPPGEAVATEAPPRRINRRDQRATTGRESHRSSQRSALVGPQGRDRQEQRPQRRSVGPSPASKVAASPEQGPQRRRPSPAPKVATASATTAATMRRPSPAPTAATSPERGHIHTCRFPSGTLQGLRDRRRCLALASVVGRRSPGSAPQRLRAGGPRRRTHEAAVAGGAPLPRRPPPTCYSRPCGCRRSCRPAGGRADPSDGTSCKR